MYAVKSVHVYKNDVVVKWAARGRRSGGSGGERGEVDEFSLASRKRLAFVASNTDVVFSCMVTLTYPGEYSSDGRDVKGHLNRFLSWARYNGCGEYLWFIEFQRRGAPHFHILTESWLEPAEVSKRWYRAVGSGDERHLRAGTRVERLRSSEGGARYAVKYAMKMYQKSVPESYRNVGRFWGHSRGVKPEPVASSEEPMRLDELKGMLGEWGYVDLLDDGPISTLFNASGYVAEKVVRKYVKENG